MKRKFSKFIFSFLLCVPISLFFHTQAQSFPDLPNDNLRYPVLLQSGDFTASGFFYNGEGATYFITARHVLFKDNFVELVGKLPIPETLRHKAGCSHDNNTDKYILIFSGVMSPEEKSELLKSAPQCCLFKDAIQKLYEKTQKLELNLNTATLFSYSLDKSVNEIEVDLKKLYEEGNIKYHPSIDVALIKVGISKISNGESKAEPLMSLLNGVVKKRGENIVGVGKNDFKLFANVLV